MSRHLDDWRGLERDGAVKIRGQDRTAVYRNTDGDVIIRQDAEYDGDVLIVLTAHNALQLCRALIDVAGLDFQLVHLSEIRVVNGAGEILAPWDEKSIAATRPEPPKRKDRTAAERKRKQRARDKDRDAGVTPAPAKPENTTVNNAPERDGQRDAGRDSVTVTPELPEIFEQYSGRHAVAAE